MPLGLDLGADDYMTKPYGPRELTRPICAASHVRGQLVSPASLS
jgi:DNA-binding response OmpR family regulator